MTDQTAQRFTYPRPLEPGQRPLLFLHRHLRAVRAAVDAPADYDILMYRPPRLNARLDGQPDELDEGDWERVSVAKYLKHRALDWREAEQLDDLPDEYQALAADLDNAVAALESGIAAALESGLDPTQVPTQEAARPNGGAA